MFGSVHGWAVGEMVQVSGALLAVVAVVVAFKTVVVHVTTRRSTSEWTATWISLVFVFLYVGSAAWLTVALIPLFSDSLVACAVAALAYICTIMLTSLVAGRMGLRTPVAALTN